MDETKRTENAKRAAAGLFLALPREAMGGWSPPAWAEAGDESLLRLAARLAMGNDGRAPIVALDRPRKSIFSVLKASKEFGPEVYHVPEPLALEKKVLFPLDSPPHFTEDEMKARIWTPLAHALDALKVQAEDPVTYVENAHLLLQRYAWNVPAPYEGKEEISFYDFARLTAGLAVCLANRGGDDSVALLVSGDVSGVQRFIYTITSKGAASALRGRSFYLQLLTEAVARYLLRALDLPVTNLLYVGGGGFTLLVPPAAKMQLEDARKHVDKVLLTHHSGDLYLAIAHVPLEEKDFSPGAISAKWNEMAMMHRRAKQRRFADMEDGLELLFTPQEHGGNEEKLCQVCGREHPETTAVKSGAGGESVRECPPCSSYEDLGKDLRRARFLRLDEVPVKFQQTDAPGKYAEVLAAFGIAAAVGKSVPAAAPGAIRSLVLALRDEAASDLQPKETVAVGRRFLVNVTPEVTQEDVEWANQKEERKPLLETFFGDPVGAIKPFDFMAAQSKGIKRLGILRMDVDNMGDMFIEGFEGKGTTLAHIASLSFAMSLFFEGWVENLAQEVDGGGNLIYSIYSGGDDLFFVGAWHLMPELARRIRVDLGRYAGGHPGVHASSGIVLVQQKYPLAQAAQDAGGAEESAKSLEGKDAISFLGRTVRWKDFGLDGSPDTVVAMKESLVNLGAPSALLQRLVRWQLMYEETSRERRKAGIPADKSFWGPWMWHAAYFLKRMEESEARKGKKGLAEGLRELREEKLDALHFSRNIEWVGLSARWAELSLRGHEKSNG